MLVICPLSSCCSYEKRDQFLSLLRPIAAVTIANEPGTISYAWFTSTGDNDEVPNHYVRGIEVYQEESALAEVHRSSLEYKKMRGSVIPENIMEKTTDLRFLRPTGVGFMRREEQMRIFQGTQENSKVDHDREIIVILEIKPRDGRKDSVRQEISKLASTIVEASDVLSFWELEYLPEYGDSGVTLFLRFARRSSYDTYRTKSSTAKALERIASIAAVRTTKWLESGIGFIGR